MQFDAAIFDLDGTLLDSMDAWARIDLAFLRRRGLRAPENYVAEICARSFEEAARYTIELFHLRETPEEVIAEWNSLAALEYAQRVRLVPHAMDYLRALRARGVRTAVATGLPEALYRPCLERNGALACFDALCSTDEVACGKEQPDVFLLAARRLNVAPARCVVFDDVLPAVLSARRAGMRVWGVYDKYSAHHRAKIERVADGYLMDFRGAPLPEGKV